jgi:Flp pilus assembly protein CpaB
MRNSGTSIKRPTFSRESKQGTIDVLNGRARARQEIVDGEPVRVRKVVEQLEATNTVLLSDRTMAENMG